MRLMPEWHLNYQVAALGAYSTIFIEALFLIIGGPLENASPLSISISTNGSAVLLAGLGGACGTSFAAIRICLTTVFLFFSIVLLTGEGTFDGTYAILCSAAQLSYHWLLRRNQRETGRFDGHSLFPESDEVLNSRDPRDHGLGDEAHWDAEKFERALTFELGDHFHVDGGVLLFTALGTALTYRVFDFDLGFGLFFASVSASWSLALLISINFMKHRGRQMEVHSAMRRRFVSISIFTLPVSYIFFALNYGDIEWANEITWWKPAAGTAWLFSLIGTFHVPLLFSLHVTLFPCATCLQRRESLNIPTSDTMSHCLWDSLMSLPALAEAEHRWESRTILHIKHQRGSDNVDKFWLNGSPFCQQTPLHTVIAFVACLPLFAVSVNLLEIERHHGILPIMSNICKVGTFYVVMTFTFAATGHTNTQNSQKLMILHGNDGFRLWYTISKALLATAFVHVALKLEAATQWGSSSDMEYLIPLKRLLSLVVPIACVSVTPLLMTGISKAPSTLDQESSHNFDNLATSQLPTREAAQPEAKLWNIDSALVYSSARFRRLDLRLLLMGICVTVYDATDSVWRYEYGPLRPSLPIISIVLRFTTAAVLFFENCIPTPRRIEPGILAAAAVAVVGVCSHQNLWDLSAVNDDHDGNRLALQISIWYGLLLTILMIDSDWVHCKPYEGRKKDLVLVKTFNVGKVGCMWQLKHVNLVLVLGLAYISSLSGNDWPFLISTTAANLLILVLIIGVRLEPQDGKDCVHQIALAISIVTTIAAILFSRNHIITYASDWDSGTRAAFFSYLVSSIVVRYSPQLRQQEQDSREVHYGK